MMLDEESDEENGKMFMEVFSNESENLPEEKSPEEKSPEEKSPKRKCVNPLPLSDNISLISSEGVNDKYVIDNLSPSWGIMLVVQDNLNLRIGIQVKKKYFNAAFWNYISTPINFAITLFTALSAGQTGSSATFLNQSQVFYILVATFVLSTINTFFKLREKADINYACAKMWESYAASFEEIYFTPIRSMQSVEIRLNQYNELINRINTGKIEETVEYVNYITELIYYCCQIFRKSTDPRHLSIHRRHWILDGISYDRYLEEIRMYPVQDVRSFSITTEVEPNFFRKTQVKMGGSQSQGFRFMRLFTPSE